MSERLSSGLWQPELEGTLIRLRPLHPEDFEALYAVGSDPSIWAIHPERDRYRRDKFIRYFQSGLDSQGALVILDRGTGQIIGSSRFTGHDVANSVVEIGYTFIARAYWGRGHNFELKRLMLNHAFQSVDRAHFFIGESNLRSRRAIEKLGAKQVRSEARTPLEGDPYTSVVFEIGKEEWLRRNAFALPSVETFIQPALSTARLELEPITELHADELWTLFADPELHRFVPFEPTTPEHQRERCRRWAKRRSPDDRELWLNWCGRDRATRNVMAHFQAGVNEEGSASVGYLVARASQRQGFAFEGLESVFTYLREVIRVREVKASSDTRNSASHRLAQKLGMIQVEHIRNADSFKGASSDEFVFTKVFGR